MSGGAVFVALSAETVEAQRILEGLKRREAESKGVRREGYARAVRIQQHRLDSLVKADKARADARCRE